MAAWCPLLSTNFKWICNPNIWNSIFASEGFTISESAPLGVCRAMASGRTRTEHFIFYKWKAGDTFWCTKFFIEVCLIIDFACLRTALLLILLLPDGWLILPPFSLSTSIKEDSHLTEWGAFWICLNLLVIAELSEGSLFLLYLGQEEGHCFGRGDLSQIRGLMNFKWYKRYLIHVFLHSDVKAKCHSVGRPVLLQTLSRLPSSCTGVVPADLLMSFAVVVLR